MRRSPADRARRDALHDFTNGRPFTASTETESDAGRTHLQALALAIEEATDLRVSILQPPLSPSVLLHVVNPQAGQLSENITCDLRGDVWSFVWSWGDTIGPAGNLDEVVTALQHVLAPKM